MPDAPPNPSSTTSRVTHSLAGWLGTARRLVEDYWDTPGVSFVIDHDDADALRSASWVKKVELVEDVATTSPYGFPPAVRGYAFVIHCEGERPPAEVTWTPLRAALARELSPLITRLYGASAAFPDDRAAVLDLIGRLIEAVLEATGIAETDPAGDLHETRPAETVQSAIEREVAARPSPADSIDLARLRTDRDYLIFVVVERLHQGLAATRLDAYRQLQRELGGNGELACSTERALKDAMQRAGIRVGNAKLRGPEALPADMKRRLLGSAGS